VLGGCFDSEFERWSNSLVEAFRRKQYVPVLSGVTSAEVEEAPEQVKDLHAELISGGAEMLLVSSDAMELLAKYEARKILGLKFRNDMLHIALARLPMLMFW